MTKGGSGRPRRERWIDGLRKSVDLLYTGRSARAAAFRYGLILFDIFTIVFFVATTPLTPTPAILAADFAIGLVILADFLARLCDVYPDGRSILICERA